MANTLQGMAGKLTYFWSFIVAILLFSVGGCFSLYEGWHKLHATEPIVNVWIALGVLALSIVLEAFSMRGCLIEVRKELRGRSLWRWIRESRSSELIVVFGEDLAALLGLVVAFGFVTIAALAGDPRFDAYGSIAVGSLLIVIAVFIAVRIKALLIGRSADPDIRAAFEEAIREEPHVVRVFNVITVQVGPQVMLAAKLRLADGISLAEGVDVINRLEVRLKREIPEVGWCFIEPDVRD
jgi:divalent metal cation (Fe/Co/Zn/Cd) transporter